jgi:hypothetical protein
VDCDENYCKTPTPRRILELLLSSWLDVGLHDVVFSITLEVEGREVHKPQMEEC